MSNDPERQVHDSRCVSLDNRLVPGVGSSDRLQRDAGEEEIVNYDFTPIDEPLQ